MRTCPHCGETIETMTKEEYEARAIPRLAEIDRLDKMCEWGNCAPSDEAEKYRETRKRLMDAQGRDEIAAGL